MLRFFRAFLNTWAARAFFVVLVAAFGLWGIGDVLRNVGRDNSLATIGSRKIEVADFQDVFRRDLAQVTRTMRGKSEPTPAIRRAIAEQSLDRMVTQAAIGEEIERLGIVVPDDKLRQAVFEMPVFRGTTGQFSRDVFDTTLRNNNYTEGRFLEMMRSDLAQRQLMETVQAGATPPQSLVSQFYALQRQTRVGEIVELPLAAAAAPPEPTADDLQRQYENNATRYSAPAYRRVKLVVLSPQTVARSLEVSDEDVKAYYEQHQGDYVLDEQRAAEVISATDEPTAQKLAAVWQAGADWASMQKAASDAGATTIVFDPTTRERFPSPDLADAVFDAAPQTVSGPSKSAFGFQVVRVTAVKAPFSRTLDQARDEVRQRVAAERAPDQVYVRANKLDDAVSAGTSLDDLPGDLGLAAVTGTLDAQGNTPEGEPAPLPGGDALRKVILAAAFGANKGEPARMIEGPEQSYYAMQVEEIVPPQVKPFDDVKELVEAHWLEARRKRSQEEVAAKLMAAAQAGGSLDDAATVAGVRMETTPKVSRIGPVEHVPSAVQEALFQLKQGQTTMVETAESFVVVRLAEIADPDPAQDAAGVAKLRDVVARDLAQDIEIVFAGAVRVRAQPRVNRALLDTLVE